MAGRVSDRLVGAEDGASPGSWQRDLLGKGQTAIVPVVERWSRYVMLFQMPDVSCCGLEVSRSNWTATIRSIRSGSCPVPNRVIG